MHNNFDDSINRYDTYDTKIKDYWLYQLFFC